MKLNKKRKLKNLEIILLKKLLSKSNLTLSYNLDNDLLVSDMQDGGMGSLLLYPPDVKENKARVFGCQISECTFKDKDNVDVIVSLNLDEEGNLYELDIWKTDYNPIIQLPLAY